MWILGLKGLTMIATLYFELRNNGSEKVFPFLNALTPTNLYS